MPLLDEYGDPQIKYLYVRDEAIREFKKGYRVILLTPSAVVRGLQIAQRAEHQDHIAQLDERWETNNLQSSGIIASLKNQLKELKAENEELVEKYAKEMDTLDKSQHEIRLLKEVQEELERAQLESSEELNAQLDAANEVNREQAKVIVEDEKRIRMLESKILSKVAMISCLQPQKWWQRLFGRGC